MTLLGQHLIGLTVRLAIFSTVGTVRTVGTVASAGKRREGKESGVTHWLEVHNEPDNEMLFMIGAGIEGRRGTGTGAHCLHWAYKYL